MTVLTAPAAGLVEISGVLREVADLKRVRTAASPDSLAERAFARSWTALLSGEPLAVIADRECAAALAGARLAGIDASILLDVGLTREDVVAVLGRAIDEQAAALPQATLERVRESVPGMVEAAGSSAFASLDVRGGRPAFVDALRRQPRAGATAPGRPRVVVEPPESHADHCWATAVFGALLAEMFDADPGEVFLLGLAHHLHNAVLPDVGFAGEMLLGAHLTPIVTRCEERVLAELPSPLAGSVRAVLELRADASTPTARAFHAADVLDRVLQVHHHARAAGFTAEQALVDLDLVHEGPVAGFHHSVLAAAGLEQP